MTRAYFPKQTNSSYNSVTKKHSIKKWAEDLVDVSKDGVSTAFRHMKNCSSLIIIREAQMNTTVRYHLLPVRMAIVKKSPE